MASSQDTKSALKLAQFQKALWDNCSIKIIEKLLDKEGDIDYAVPINSPIRHVLPRYLGYTALHFTSLSYKIAALNALVNRGADFTKRDEKGETILHNCVNTQRSQHPSNSCIKALLSAHVNTNNFSNPCNNSGRSHFHIACMENDSRAVQFFLENGISADEPDLSGYTPLHYAAFNTNTEVAELLFEHGVNMYATDAKGMTPLHLLIERRIHMCNSISDPTSQKENSHEKLQKDMLENEKIINMLLENMIDDDDCLDSIGMSNFHVACVLQDTSPAEQLVDQVIDLDHCVNMDSPLCPGYTALHFAAHVSIETVEMLVKKGANLSAMDSKGKTPLDICIEKYKVEEVCGIMSLSATCSNMLFSNNHQVLSVIRVFANKNHFKRFLDRSMCVNTFIPMGSALWPGYTPLHLAVQFAKKRSSKQPHHDDEEAKNETDLQVIRVCLKNNANLSAQDSRGQTALHLAYRLGKITVVDVIFRHSRQIPNVCDDENLSHLHIACATGNTKLKLKKIALNNEDVNTAYRGTSQLNIVYPGSTPLHVSIVNKRYSEDLKNIIKVLLNNGADVNVKDSYGLTPIHWILKFRFYGCEDLLYETTSDCEAEQYGINYLHVACYLADPEAVKYFIEKGANVNLAIRYSCRGVDDPLQFLSKYNKYTALHFCAFSSTGTLKLLLEHGADVFAEKANGSACIDDVSVRNVFIAKVWNDVELQARMEREFGWTRLHLACYLLQTNGFEDLIVVESRNINARVFLNSPIWKGCTPLHLLLHRPITSDDRIITILLEHGADVTIADDNENTPIGMLFKEAWNYKEREVSASLMLKYHRDFSVNPVNIQSVSYFHVACYLNDVDAVQGFLSHGNVDVNQPIDYFSHWHPGYTPLHLASQIQIFELLINHGANIHAENVEGRTVLHNAVEGDTFDENIITKLIESGADVNGTNFRGETPFEIAISKSQITMEKLMFFIRNGFHVNTCNPITGVGYIAIVLRTNYDTVDLKKLIIEQIIKENPLNTMGRTMLHNCVAVNWALVYNDDYVALIEKLIKSGDKFEQLDDEGKTALHIAVDFRNNKAIEGLLASGFDINFMDANGRSALSSTPNETASIHSDTKSTRDILTIHACRLLLLNLHLNRIDTDIVNNTQQSIRGYAVSEYFHSQITLCKETGLINGMCLYDFLSETGAVASYPLLKEEDRKMIDQYFETINTNRSLINIKGILKLQYRKAIKRIELLPSSEDSFNLLLGFNLPYLCVKQLFRYLGNSDLQNIINAAMENENMAMDVD